MDLQNYNLIGNYQIFKEYLRLKNRLDFCHHRLNRDVYPWNLLYKLNRRKRCPDHKKDDHRP